MSANNAPVSGADLLHDFARLPRHLPLIFTRYCLDIYAKGASANGPVVESMVKDMAGIERAWAKRGAGAAQ